MSTLSYTGVGLYKLPRKNILVISCMDLRLTDNLVEFLHYDNLHNRYDHFILAGASLSWSAPDEVGKVNHAEGVPSHKGGFEFRYTALNDFDCFNHWKKSLADHINLAVALHHIRDVYIIEHEDCGAYHNFLHDPAFHSPDAEKACHMHFAKALAEDITATDYNYGAGAYRLNVHSFYIDLRGNVELLHTLDGHH